MRRTTIMADEALLAGLEAIARAEGQPLAEIIRQALRQRLGASAAASAFRRHRHLPQRAGRLGGAGEPRPSPLALICDTGPRYAAMDRRDQDHARCAQLLTTSVEPRVIPAPVLVEVEWLASSRLAASAFDAVLADIESGGFRIIDLTVADYFRIRELCRAYADLPLGFVDASVIAMAERLGEPRIATLDHRHFGIVRTVHADELELLPH